MTILVNNIKLKMKSNPFLLLILICSQAFVAMMILLVYGIAMNSFKSDQKATLLNKFYTISLQNSLSKDEFESKIFPLLAILQDDLDYMYCQGYVDHTTLSMIYCGSNREYTADAFTYEQLSQNAHVADANYATTKTHIGDVVNIGDEQFEVKWTDEGVDYGAEMTNDYRIPYGTAPVDTFFYDFRLILKDMPTEQLDDKISSYIVSSFDVKEYTPAEIIDAEVEQRRQFSIIICFVVALIMILCLCYVYAFLVRKRRKQLGVIIMCGCKPEEANNIFTGEILLYVLIGCLISIPIVKNIIYVFDNLYGSFSQYYNYKIYISAITGYVLLTAFVLTLFLRPIVKNAIESLRKGAL